MNKKNRGFTLIELLAVIIILSILMIIAVPSVTKYISDARKKAYVSTISSYVQSVSVKMLAFGFGQKPRKNQALLISFSEIKMEKKAVSPYGKFLEEQCYIIVLANDGGKYSFYVNIKDSSGYKVYNVKSSNININTPTTSTNIKDPVKISEIKNGIIVKIGENNFKISENNNIDSKFILLESA